MKLFFVFLFLAIVLALPSFAQSTGRVSGSVLDASGAAVPGATVSLYVPDGTSPFATTVTTSEGYFFFAGVRPIQIDFSVEAKGFQPHRLRRIKVDAGLELSVPPITLEVSAQTAVVEVSADAQTIQTSNAEVAAVVASEQFRKLPTLDRDPMQLISTQAGVGGNGRTATTINGLRPSFTNITLDGINIQDNFIRSNAVSFIPNRVLLDQVAETTIATTNTSVADGAGVAQIKFVPPSGTNSLHGSLSWYNRNNAFAANEWFNNASSVDSPFLNQNQIGGRVSGPIIKDKLFYNGSYEATRRRQQSAFSGTVLTPDARNGIYTYRDVNTGALRQANVLQVANVSADAKMKDFLGLLPATINRPDIGDGLNTGGYGLNRRDNTTRDNVTVKMDYVASPKHVFTGTYYWNRELVDRPDADEIFTPEPAIGNDGKTNLVSATWRWSPLPNVTNELRGGFNDAPGLFNARTPYPSYLLDLTTTPLITNPVNAFMPQGRYTNTRNIQDNVNWYKGKHSFTFGVQWQGIQADSFDNFDTLPTYRITMGPSNTNRLTAGQLPGISASDLNRANLLLALHGGYMDRALQAFNVTSVNSGYVAGAENLSKLRLQTYAAYFGDTWRMSRKLTVTLGVRWEYYTPVTEARGLSLLPKLKNGNPVATLLDPNGVLDFAGTVLKRPWYNKDLNNFGPNVGLAWQPFGDNKTVLRAGYSVNYPNDEFIRSVDNNVYTNSGLNTTVVQAGLVNTVGAPPTLRAPVFKVPRTFLDNYMLDPGSAFGMPDPNLRTPYVQQWNVGIQREIAQGVLEVRYVGSHSTKQFRAFDYNQVLVQEDELPGFLSNFRMAANNGLLSQKQTGVFDPMYNPTIPGSQHTPFFDALPYGGLLDDPYIIDLIQRGMVGELGLTYQYYELNGDTNFFRNPYALGTNMMSNYSNASYHSAQIDYRRTFRSGFGFQANYTFSKSLSDAGGDGQTQFEPFLDNRNAAIERARTPFDLTHSFKVNGQVDLPFGKDKWVRIDNRIANSIFGGWSLSGFMTWQSGNPFSVLSSRATLNRAGSRSLQNTAVTSLNKGELDKLFGVRMTGNGPVFINPSAVNPADGRGVAPDGAAAFSGQVFYNPAAGTIGTLQRRMFSGPAQWNTDLSLMKTFDIRDGHSLEFRTEWMNFTNTPSFYVGDQDINSTSFGNITNTVSSRRIIQFGLYYRF